MFITMRLRWFADIFRKTFKICCIRMHFCLGNHLRSLRRMRPEDKTTT